MNQIQFETICILLFFINYDVYSQIRFKSVATEQKSVFCDVNEFVSTIKAIISHLCSEMIAVQTH